ncbi:hypothetical protein [Mesobacillus foraminis]|uniref:Uncharacterized protein n=1 Tax=Mesobacillus foraminis TaxID=279826 RepID=A0A4R2BI85_9BACI|nr:hypothetical protein [Mesobacillus foraminis]TCN26152.1 hypothetical protein EV146_104260 [Mesobacillus foraminis]
MKKSALNFVLGATVVGLAVYRMSQKEAVKIIEDTDMRNSEKIDKQESVDAEKVPEEKGLTQYDSALRAEWVANGFPQTHMEMEGYGEQRN